jgi:hypothetical protein
LPLVRPQRWPTRPPSRLRRHASELLGSFIGNAAFSHHAGELHYTVVGANTIVAGDVNGDAKADFEILLSGHPALTQSDFIGTLAAANANHTANITLLGQYMAGNFHPSTDHHGGTIVTDLHIKNANEVQSAALANPH